MSRLPPLVLKESFGAKLRRLAAGASNGNNRADALPLMPPPAWATGQTVVKGNVRANAGSWYQAITAGTTGATAPTGGVASSAVISDGAINWTWIGYASVTSNDPLAPTSITSSTVSAASVLAALTNTWPAGSFVNSIFRAYGDIWTNASGQGNFWGYQIAPYPTIAVGATYALNTFGYTPHSNYELTTLGTGPIASVPSGTSTYTDANGNVWTYIGGGVKSSTVKTAFWVNDYAFALKLSNFDQYNPVKVSIDGRYVSSDGLLATSSTVTYFVLQFATKQKRLVTIEWPQFMQLPPGFYGVVTTPTGDVWAPATRDDVRAMFISDSIFDGNSIYGPYIPGSQVGRRVSERMGWTDCWQWALSGTGWVNGISGTARTFGQRIPDALAINPDIWIFMGSTNDNSLAAATISASVLAGLQAIRSGGSTAPIVVFGVWSINALSLATEQAVQAGVSAFADPLGMTFFVPVYQDATLSWITGTWNNAGGAWNGATSNTSAVNSGAYISADNTHPPDPGSDYLANRIVRALNTSVLPLLN